MSLEFSVVKAFMFSGKKIEIKTVKGLIFFALVFLVRLDEILFIKDVGLTFSGTFDYILICTILFTTYVTTNNFNCDII